MYTITKSGSFIYIVNIYTHTKMYEQISPVVHFLPVTIVQKQERVVNLVLNIEGVY